MKLIVTLILAIFILGCGFTVNGPTPPLAPGYNSTEDQKLGQTLAGIAGFTSQEKANYAQLPAAQQATEKPYLNALIDALNIADDAYVGYHKGTQTLAMAQTAVAKAESAQTALAANKGAK